jgi:GTPase
MTDIQGVKTTKVGVCIAGSVDSGKSSFIGVMISNKLDDGNGSARKLVAKHQHEVESGKTSDISTKIMDVPENNSAITIVDLCGHQKYFHTTTYGLTSHFCDYAFLVISANKGVLPMTKQHIRVLLSLCVPICIIVTHLDITPYNIYSETMLDIDSTIKQFFGKTSKVLTCNTNKEIDMEATELTKKKELVKTQITDYMNKIGNNKQNYFPVITISNKTGYFIDVVSHILKNLQPRQLWPTYTAKPTTISTKTETQPIAGPQVDSTVVNTPTVTLKIEDQTTKDTHVDPVVLNTPAVNPVIANPDISYFQENKIIKFFLNAIKTKKMENCIGKYDFGTGSIFYIDNCYNPPGIGLVVSGICRGNNINIGETMYIGPVIKNFVPIRVKSIHNNAREPMQTITDHDRGSIAMFLANKGDIKRNQIRKGMILLSSLSMVSHVCYRVKAIVTFFAKSITIRSGYSPVIHIGTIRQTVRITVDPAENDGSDVIGFESGKQNFGIITFKFKMNPEYVEPYNIFLVRSGEVHGIGMILCTIPLEQDIDANPDPYKIKRHK